MGTLEESAARQWERGGVQHPHLNRVATKGLPEKETFESAESEGPDWEEARDYPGEASPAEGTARAEEGWRNSKSMRLERNGQRERGRSQGQHAEVGQMVRTSPLRWDSPVGHAEQ